MLKGYERLLRYSLWLISRKRYTRKEIQTKLEQFFKRKKMEGEIDQEVAKVMTRLDDLRYLDDLQYAVDYVDSRVRMKPRGRFMLRKELRHKGISKEMAEKVVDDSDFDEGELGYDLICRCRGRWKKYPEREQKQKAYRYLAYRGFDKDAIYKVLSRCYDRVK